MRDAKTASIDGRVRTAAVRVFGFANPRFQTFDRARSIGAIEGSGRRPPRRIARRDKGAQSTERLSTSHSRRNLGNPEARALTAPLHPSLRPTTTRLDVSLITRRRKPPCRTPKTSVN